MSISSRSNNNNNNPDPKYLPTFLNTNKPTEKMQTLYIDLGRGKIADYIARFDPSKWNVTITKQKIVSHPNNFLEKHFHILGEIQVPEKNVKPTSAFEETTISVDTSTEANYKINVLHQGRSYRIDAMNQDTKKMLTSCTFERAQGLNKKIMAFNQLKSEFIETLNGYAEKLKKSLDEDVICFNKKRKKIKYDFLKALSEAIKEYQYELQDDVNIPKSINTIIKKTKETFSTDQQEQIEAGINSTVNGLLQKMETEEKKLCDNYAINVNVAASNSNNNNTLD